MRKILFLHGFFASGSCIPAVALTQALEGQAEVLSPDLPMNPQQALEFITGLCKSEKPDVMVGNSNGAFMAQMAAQITGTPALLGNPHFEMTKFLEQRRGAHKYKSPRRDGRQDFVIDDALISDFGEMQAHQFDLCREDMRDKVWGLFGDNDTLAHYEPVFRQHYSRVFHFPGNHTPTAEEVKEWYAPLAIKLIGECAL